MAAQKNLIDNCEDLMLPAFAKAVNEGDLSVLGEGSAKELEAAWDKIMEEYNSILGRSNDTIVWRKRVQLQGLISRYNRVLIGVNIYFKSPLNDENKKEVLRLLAIDKININPKANKEQEIERINRQLKAIKVNIDFKTSELKAISPDNTDKKEFDVTAQLYQLEKITDAKYKIRPEETSLKLYALLVKDAERITSKSKAA